MKSENSRLIKAKCNFSHNYALTYRKAREMEKALKFNGYRVVAIYRPGEHVKHITDYIICWRKIND